MCVCCLFKSTSGNHKSIHFNLTFLLLFAVDNFINYGVPNKRSQQCPSMGTDLVEGLVFCPRQGNGPIQCPILILLFIYVWPTKHYMVKSKYVLMFYKIVH